MSKQIHSAAAAFASWACAHRRGASIVFLGCLLLFAPAILTSSARQEPANATTAARNAALVAATDEVLDETSALRNLAVLKPVRSSTKSRDEIERSIVKNLDEDTSPEDLHATEVVLKTLGLAPADFQYRELMVRLLREQIAGYYEPRTQQFHLADWIEVDAQRPIIAHELTHALQDQHFDLRRFQKWPKGDADAELAAHALIEGDATLAMVMYVTSNRLRALSFLQSLNTMGTSDELNKAPRAVRESLLFSYQEGLNFARTLYREGGWAAVSQAYNELPKSTEQVLHPEKYFAREAPVAVTIPELIARGKSLTGHPPGGWTRIASNVNGEWGFYLILDQFLKSPAESRRAAAGWAGDRFEAYQNGSGQLIYVSSSVWDTESDAREFFDAYMKRTRMVYPAGKLSRATVNMMALTTREHQVQAQLRGRRVVIVEAPGSVHPSRLRAMLSH